MDLWQWRGQKTNDGVKRHWGRRETKTKVKQGYRQIEDEAEEDEKDDGEEEDEEENSG